MPEFGYFSLPASLSSGSSIMPQKKNPDGLELLRGKAASMAGWCSGMKNVIRALPTGYNRDFQETKELFIKVLDTADISTQVAKLTVDELKVNKAKLKKGFTPDIFATDEALRLVASGMSFRDAYKQVGLNMDKLKNEDPASALKKRTSTGTPGNLNLKYAKDKKAAFNVFAEDEHTALAEAVEKLTGFPDLF